MIHHKPRRIAVAVIGAGSSGIVTAKALLAEGCFDVTVFEKRSTLGGVWCYTRETAGRDQLAPDPHRPQPVARGKDGTPIYISAMYDNLITNIPHTMMAYRDAPFPRQPIYTGREHVRAYLEQYGRQYAELVEFSTQVEHLEKTEGTWQVRTRHVVTGRVDTRGFDAVAVCQGHYDTPFVPHVEGLEAFAASHTVFHSKYFRSGEQLRGRRVLVVGNAASGGDIAAQVAELAETLYLSIRSPSKFPFSHPRIQEVPQVQCFHADRDSAMLVDGREIAVDVVIYCTGYLKSFLYGAHFSSGPDAIITDGTRLRRLYQHIFYIPDPSLAVIGLPKWVIPFITSETQAAVLARVWHGRLTLPPEQAMRGWEAEQVQLRGDGMHFHDLNYPADADYADELYHWIQQAKGAAKEEFLPVKWDARMRSYRSRFGALKQRFSELKKQGIVCYSVEEILELGLS